MLGPPNLETILRTGQILGAQYRVDRLIAKGGMAAVWAGVNQHTGKRVALKVILHSFASHGEAAELFHREALAASKVNHPNVVDIFDVIAYEGNTCIVMELLDGETLGSYLARNAPLSLEATVALLLPAMRGVAAANAQGVVHRDLKPGNIFLCSDPDGRLLTTKVLDFGISVMMKRAGEVSTAIAPLAMFGTPAYMAPEAIEFSPNIDGRADVYGFGVLLFETLTGKLPFLGQPGMDLLKRILTDPPPKVTLYRSDLSSEVVRLIDCALAKNANDRFPDMEHLIRATEDRLLTLPSTARSLPPISCRPSIPSARSDFSAAVPRVEAANEKAPSARAHLIETRVLYSLPSEPVRATDGAGIARGRKLSPAKTVSRTRRSRVSFPASWSLLNRRAASGAGLVAFLIVTGWVAAPASSSNGGVGQGQSSGLSEIEALARRPWVAPLAGTPSLAPSPASIADNPHGPVADSESTRANGPLAPVPTLEAQPSDRTVMDIAGPSIRKTVRHPSKRSSRAESTPPQPPTADLPDQPTAPRAGRLSPSDF
jgi:serine/threonine-protein kinase